MTERPTQLLGPTQGRWLGWLGHPVRYLATKAETGGRYCISTAPVHAGGGAPPHRHDFGEGFYVLDGRVEFTAGSQRVVLSKGEFIHITGGTVHFRRALVDSQLLTIAAPTGFDQFQIEAGEELAEEASPLNKTVDQILNDVHAIAREYGIDMNPPPDASKADPQIHVARLDDGDIVDAVGDRYRFLAESEQTGGTYAICGATISPGGGPPLHTHSLEDEAFYVLNGEIRFEADGKEFVGKPGAFVNLPSGSRHRFSNQSHRAAEVLILVAPAGLEAMFRKTGQLVTDITRTINSSQDDEKKQLVEIAPMCGVELFPKD
ncbi:MAG: cupin domain-containing protein [Planctomycetota bacterium]